jgi:hypothetical protein
MKDLDQINYELAKKHVEKIKGFYIHLLIYVLLNLFFLFNKAQNRTLDQFLTFSTFSTAFYWGLGIAYHAISVFGKNLFLGKKWEEKKIKQFLEEEKNKIWL